VLGVDDKVLRLDRQEAASGHRIARVDEEVNQHLLELSAIATRLTERRVQADGDRDVLAEQPLEHCVRVIDDVVEREHDRFGQLFACEREELSRQQGSAFGRFVNRFDRRLD
jgi:hypothetical protein